MLDAIVVKFFIIDTFKFKEIRNVNVKRIEGKHDTERLDLVPMKFQFQPNDISAINSFRVNPDTLD